MVSLDIAEKSHEERNFCLDIAEKSHEERNFCAFFGRPVRDYVRGATSRIMKFDAKDK